MDIPRLRALLPEFADAIKYPDANIQAWLDIASIRLDGQLWGNRLDEGLLYSTAHSVKLAALNARPGGNSAGGVVASKSVGPASVSYDNSLSKIEGAGDYNLTSYGRQFWMLCQMVGAGGIQINPVGYAGYGAIGIPPNGRIIN